jgi:hypothetical protein
VPGSTLKGRILSGDYRWSTLFVPRVKGLTTPDTTRCVVQVLPAPAAWVELGGWRLASFVAGTCGFEARLPVFAAAAAHAAAPAASAAARRRGRLGVCFFMDREGMPSCGAKTLGLRPVTRSRPGRAGRAGCLGEGRGPERVSVSRDWGCRGWEVETYGPRPSVWKLMAPNPSVTPDKVPFCKPTPVNVDIDARKFPFRQPTSRNTRVRGRKFPSQASGLPMALRLFADGLNAGSLPAWPTRSLRSAVAFRRRAIAAAMGG